MMTMGLGATVPETITEVAGTPPPESVRTAVVMALTWPGRKLMSAMSSGSTVTLSGSAFDPAVWGISLAVWGALVYMIIKQRGPGE